MVFATVYLVRGEVGRRREGLVKTVAVDLPATPSEHVKE
jgi:hypothetical protein